MKHKRKIKILFLVDYLFGFGGTEKHIFQLATRLDPSKFECTVCAMRFGSEIVETFRKAGVRIMPLYFKKIYDLSAIRLAFRLSKFLRKERIDIVQSFNVDSDIYGALIARLGHTPVFISSRRDLAGYRKRHHLKITNITNRYVSHFIAVCRAAAEMISSMEGVKPDKITIIYNGIDLHEIPQVDNNVVEMLRKKLNITSTSFVIGNVAHFRPEKGHAFFLKAISRIKSIIPDVRVICIGSSDLLPIFEREVKQNGLANNVFFTGYIENVFDYLAIMDITCLTPISNEGFSNALLEQMAMGKAIIATDVGGNREAIINSECGIIIPANDEQALSNAILELYNNPEHRQKLGQNAQVCVKSLFGLDKMIMQMEKLYTELAQKQE
jgi:glycosyltransferase involved in cell wall biosynthesis